MLIDARALLNRHNIETDICIVGAGAAGITLAREFAGQAFRVLLLESGGFDYNEETQSLYRGKNIGLPYFPLEIPRLRQFGGTTNHWGGMCRPFDQIDFEPREWIPYSGWPFPKSVIDPFYKRALSVFKLQNDEWTPEFWGEPDKPLLPLVSDRVVTSIMQQVYYQGRRLRFGRTYRDEVIQARNIIVCFHGNVTRIETDESGKKVNRLRCASLSGKQFSVTAKIVILATGAIENARLLLLSNDRQPAGLGNQNDLVGRFFLEHPKFVAAIFRPSNPRLPVQFYERHKVRDSAIAAGLEMSEEVRRREELVNVRVGLETAYDEFYAKASESKGVESLRYLFKKLRRGDLPEEFGKHLGNVAVDLDDVAVAAYGNFRFGGDYPIDHITLTATIDPAPNRDSRVTLGAGLDALGQRRVNLDWRLSPIDMRSVRRTLEIIGMELGRAGLGRIQIKIDDSDTTWPEGLSGVSHHMGTTRMSDDPREGVVDKNCQVHGISNLFVAGSSVFPTAGSGTPTFLIGALALRLADHLKRKMR